MSFAVICRSCGARLKLPPGCTKKKARCPKCDARVDMTPVLNATVYRPAQAANGAPKPATATAENRGLTPPARQARQDEREEDPLPYLDLNPTVRPPLAKTSPPAAAPGDAPLSLDDSREPEVNTAGSPAGDSPEPPLRASARVTADSTGLFTGPCEVVIVPHGLFLESVPYRPFLYVPVRTPVDTPGHRGLAVTLPDGRTVTLEFTGPGGRQLADDTAAFLAGERAAPSPREYRRAPPWLVAVAVVLALGLAVGPLVLSQTADLGLKTGLLLGAAFAGVGLLANVAVVLFARISVAGKVASMALAGGLVTGVFLFGATAYLAGRKHEAEQPKSEPQPPPQPPPKPPEPPPQPPDPPPSRPPTAVDKAYSDGVYRFEDGPADVTALGVSADGSTLVIGYKDGTTRVWNFEHATIDPFNIGPKCDGAPTRIQFDRTGNVVYMTGTGGTVAAPVIPPPEVPAKIPGDPLALFAFPGGERFAAVRGNTLVLRYVPTTLITKPAAKGAKGFLVTAPRDETIPNDAKAALVPPPQRPTFLAWHPTGKLLAGQPDGGILSWGPSGPGYTRVSREHAAAVRAWAASPSTWDFATGDDRGVVGLWENKAMTPKTFTAASGAITQLAFSPSGSHLAVADAAGVRVWDLWTQRSILRVTRSGAKVAFGPNDDLLLLSDGKAVELWSVSELAKQP